MRIRTLQDRWSVRPMLSLPLGTRRLDHFLCEQANQMPSNFYSIQIHFHIRYESANDRL